LGRYLVVLYMDNAGVKTFLFRGNMYQGQLEAISSICLDWQTE